MPFKHALTTASFIALNLLQLPLVAQPYLYDVQEINIEEGLPNRRVFSVTQGQDGFLWVSTPGAISLYDGYQFETYNASFLTISENNAAFLAVDKDNYLWYCEKKGVETPNYSGIIDMRRDTVYDLETFTQGLLSSKDVIHISQSKINREDLFISTRQGVVYKYNGAFEVIYRMPGEIRNFIVCEALPDSSYQILHARSMARVKNGRLLDSFQVEPPGLFQIVALPPETIFETRNFAYLPNYWVLQNRQLAPWSPKNYSPEDITALFQAHEGYTYFATHEAIVIQDDAGRQLLNYPVLKTPGKAENLRYYNGTFMGLDNTLWIGSDDGLIRISRKQNPFKTLQAGNSIRGVFRDKDGLWIGGYRQNVYESLTGKAPPSAIPPHPAATSFVKGTQGNLWAGTDGFILMEYIRAQNRWEKYDFSAQGKRLFQLFQNPATGKLWVGTSDGLAYLDHENKQLIPFPLPLPSKNTYIRHFYQNEQGIWILSSKGLFLMDSRTEAILQHYSTADGLPSENLIHLHEDAEGIFWLASRGGGLIRWDLQKNTFRQFTREDGLSDNTIYAVYEGPDGHRGENLWLPSNHGLMRFNKNAQDVRVYLPQHGIAHEEFNTFAHFQDESGALYFGGLNGLVLFHPKDVIQEQGTNIPLRLAKLRVLEKDAEDFVDKTESFRAANIVRLEPGSRILELEARLLDYESAADKQYAYKIEGLQDQWIYTSENKITIINLPYDSYTIKIKARGAAGVWSDKLLSIPVVVRKPFYLQWWFVLAAAVLGVGGLTTAIRWWINWLERDRAWLEAEVQKRTRQIEEDKQVIAAQTEALQELDKAKTHFFSNITHEFRTPLTLIIGSLEQVLSEQSPPAFLRRRIQGALKNARHILKLINQLLDLSKIESRTMKVEAVRGNIIAYTRELAMRFQALAGKKELRLDFISGQDNWKTNFDQDKWDKIVYNLLSNAIKFTPPGKAIQLNLAREENDGREFIRLDVKDTGMGIDKKQMKRVFDRFYQAEPDGYQDSTLTQGGTGIGLALVKELVELQGGKVSVSSELGKGALFRVLLPVLPAEKTVPLADSPAQDTILGPEPLADEAAPIVPAPSGEKGEKLELLIIEDNQEMREYIRYCVGEDKYHITETANGEEGIEKAQALTPDLIISDVMMPKKDGLAVTQAIRDNLSTSHIPLILLTAKATLESRLEGLRRGADAYLTKPFSPQELVLRVEKLIEIRQMLRQRYLTGAIVESGDAYRQEDEFITELRAYILARIDEPDLSGDRIGRHFGMSRVHLYRKLKALTGQPITEFVKAVRLEKALELVQKGKLNISEITYQTGFNSVSHFSRSFKKQFGKPPSEF